MSEQTHKTTIVFPDSPGASLDVFREDGRVVIVSLGPNGNGIRTVLSDVDTNLLLMAIMRARVSP